MRFVSKSSLSRYAQPVPTPSINFRIPAALVEEGRRVAKTNGTSLNALVIWLLGQHLTDVEWRDRALAAEAELRRIKGEQ